MDKCQTNIDIRLCGHEYIDRSGIAVATQAWKKWPGTDCLYMHRITCCIVHKNKAYVFKHVLAWLHLHNCLFELPCFDQEKSLDQLHPLHPFTLPQWMSCFSTGGTWLCRFDALEWWIDYKVVYNYLNLVAHVQTVCTRPLCFVGKFGLGMRMWCCMYIRP